MGLARFNESINEKIESASIKNKKLVTLFKDIYLNK